ncbi:hypothetical protein [Saccharopolyspora phatthalungensis]|uniref:Uncharacterized protein n=1 Tax=Saccharopolyspora phatthalungensis TaxID=664693 RepID=A0A840QCB5_9PSEU|nr:hypothetical protein [Saccharopolyspora phatthalungensis]MBB5157420.1 hypothetical protein [Saccharopolyspora phatthalungensis]
MLPIPTHHDPNRTSRRSLHEDLTSPRPTRTTPNPQQPTLFTRTGRPRPAARPPQPGNPGAMPVRIRPGEQHYLPLVGPFTSQATPPPGPKPTVPADQPPPRPARPPGQQALLSTTGEVRPQARARRPARPSPVVPPAYKGIRPDRDGQYRLPLNVPKKPARHRGRRPAAEEPGPPSPARHPEQPELPLNLPATRPPQPRTTPRGGRTR